MSTSSLEIHLRNVRLYAYHGLNAGEEVLGGEFEINLTVSFIPATFLIRNIEQTIDYTAVYEIVAERMTKPSPLLETVATEIAGEIIDKFSVVAEVVISIFKLHSPINNFEGSVGVTFSYQRSLHD